MKTARSNFLPRALALGLAAFGLLLANAPSRAAGPVLEQGRLVVYGQQAPSREGDVDHREQIFFSIPADQRQRVYVRIFDPEVSGADDFTYGGTGNSETTYRVFGGRGAFSEADRPTPVADNARVPRKTGAEPAAGPGRMLREKIYTNDRSTDGRWVTIAAVRARQGEIIDGRAWFRLDALGTGGDDGNGFSVGISLARDRDRAPDGLQMFSYQPTVRWEAGRTATQLWFADPAPGSLTIQSFDGAKGRLALVTDYADIELPISGQDHWRSADTVAPEGSLALSLLGGFETPNDVTLAVYDDQGRPVPLRVPPFRAPQPERPTAKASGRALADCRSVAFDGTGSTGLTPLQSVWDFGDGATGTGSVIAHRYNTPGRYTVRLRVQEEGSRPGRGDETEIGVHVRNAPIAAPGAPITVAPGQALPFDGSGSVASDAPIARYLWSFGDGATAAGSQASHAYGKPGEYRAVLRVEDDSGHPCDFGVATRLVTVNFPPVAEAGADQSAIIGQAITVSGAASYDVDGSIGSWVWDMGDGTKLQGPTVTHRYEQSGIYPVVLTVVDDSGVVNDTAMDRLQIEVNAPPVPRFGIPERPLSVSEATTLDASASTDADGRILSYMWDFGDGAMGEGPVVSYAWTEPGNYSVTLKVTDDSGTASALQSLTQMVRVDAAPVANAGADRFVSSSVVRFDGTGSLDTDGSVTEWLWDFGDGSAGQGPQPEHIYRSPGRYEVSLRVRDDSGAPLNTARDKMIVMVNAAPIADAGPSQVVAPGEEFQLSASGSLDPDGGIADYLWVFPDGQTARGARTAYSLGQPGLHRIGLTVTDDFPVEPAQDETETLIIVNAQPVAVAGPDRLVAPGDVLTFDAGQSFDPDGQLSGFRWEFDDLGMPLEARVVERAYDTPGTWSAQLVVSDDSGVLNAAASDDVTIRVNAPPVAEAGMDVVSDSLIVTFDGSGSSDPDGDSLIYRWDPGDGSDPIFGPVAKHAYATPGIYPVTLWVDDGNALSNSRASDATRVTVRSRPVANAGGNREVCSGQQLLFDASASLDPDGGLLLYDWDFGDGSTSNIINPTKTYERPGTYPVTLRVRNETGTEWGTATDRIAALVREGPIADAGPDRTVCSNQPIRFDGSGSTDADGAVNAFAWDFGDSKVANGERPLHVFTRPGTYTVTLTITGEALGSCSPLDTDVAEYTVVEAPELVIEAGSVAAQGIAHTFNATLMQEGYDLERASVAWDFGDGATGAGTSAEHVFTQPGEYLVKARVTLPVAEGSAQAQCNQLETQRKITVNAAPMVQLTAPDQASIGQELRFSATGSSDPDGALAGFVWDFGDGSTARGVEVDHSYASAGDYTVTLTVFDDAEVANSAVQRTARINVLPAPDPELLAKAPVCPAVPVAWNIRAPDGADVAWSFGGTSGSAGADVTHSFAKPGVYPVSARINDGADLPGSIRTYEVYQRVNAAPVALAGPDRLVCPGDRVVFDAGSALDPDGEIQEWLWSFSDGVTLSGKTVDRVFDTSADLSVTLSVRDNSGADGCDVGQDTARILVNAPPQLELGADIETFVGGAHDVLRFAPGTVTDPDGHGVRIRWEFGDGATASGQVARHRFVEPGTYQVTAHAQDATGLQCGQTSDSVTVTANSRP